MRADEPAGPRCPLTGRTVAEELQHAVYELATRGVHERDGVRYNDAEYRAFCDGWYHALAIAGAAMDAAIARRRVRLHGQRHDTTVRSVDPGRARPVPTGRARGRAGPAAARDGGTASAAAGRPRDRSRER